MRLCLLMTYLLLVAVTASGQVTPSHVGTERRRHLSEHGAQPVIFRHATFNQAWAAAQAVQRPVLLYVTSDNCLYCKKMLRHTLADPHISQVIAEHAESFAFNATESPELAQKLGVRSFPTTLIISPSRELICQIEGFVEPQEFAKRVWPAFQHAESPRQVVQFAN